MNYNIKRTIKWFMLDEWNKISLDVTCEGVYFVLLNGKEQIVNTIDREEAERVFKEMKQ